MAIFSYFVCFKKEKRNGVKMSYNNLALNFFNH